MTPALPHRTSNRTIRVLPNGRVSVSIAPDAPRERDWKAVTIAVIEELEGDGLEVSALNLAHALCASYALAVGRLKALRRMGLIK